MTATVKSPAAKFRQLAAGMVDKIEHLRRPMSQRPTPKRSREYAGRCIDGDNLDRGRRALLVLADAWDRNDVPPVLRDLRNRDDICRLVWHGQESSGYYNVHSTYQYADTSPAGKALQELVARVTSPLDIDAQAAVERKRKVEEAIDAIRFRPIPGFFPTPPQVVSLLLAYAQIEPGHVVLEPSAGIGSIADEIVKIKPLCLCCEIRPSLRDILKLKGHTLTQATDFLEMERGEDFNRIVMNPPFENGQDIEHVQHAYDVLAPGGRLVAIMSNGPFFREDRKSETFRDWLEFVDVTVDDLPDDAFNGVDAFRTTGVKCKVVVINK